MKKYLKWLGGVLAIVAIAVVLYLSLKKNPVIKVGYFHGGRTMLLFRALVNDYFEDEGLTAIFVTKQLRSKEWKEYDRKGDASTFTGKKAGKATGLELTQLLLEKKVDVSFIGEAAFLKACSLNQPIVAIAQLGADEKDKGGHSIVIKQGIKIKGPRDLEKITWGTRRSSGGDDVFLKEFLHQSGVDLSKVKIISQIDDDKISYFLKIGKIQGAYHHLMMVRNDENNGIVYTYRKLDWVDPSMSQAIAVVSKDFLLNNRLMLKKFIKAYMKRIAYEKSLSGDDRQKKIIMRDGKSFDVSLYELEMDHKGMNLPQYPRIPIINKDLTEQAVEIFYRHKFILTKPKIENCYDNSIVNEVAKELYPTGTSEGK